MTEYLPVDGGTIAYEVAGSGPLVVLAHGMGDSRAAFRHVAPRLVAAGYRVASVDLRGCGESSVDWPSWSRTDIAGDLLAVIRHLGGPAVLVGHSVSGGAATVAAAAEPSLVTAVVELAPFTRKQSLRLGDLRVARFRRGMLRLLGAGVLGSLPLWRSYLDVAYPGVKPDDWTERLGRIDSLLREPGRMKAMQSMGRSAPTDSRRPARPRPLPGPGGDGHGGPRLGRPARRGLGGRRGPAVRPRPPRDDRGAGHYPHDQYPDRVVALVLDFLRAEAARA
ncbi:alpha/beta hydrolase [Streptomyces sp. UP1A-1]|nr:alpha/beta hydrolase [Streptomyces sp. UP1A-1]